MRAVHLLAASSLFSAWGDRMWSFAIGLFFIKLTPGTLQLAAVYGLVTTLIAIIFAPIIGDWVDNTERLKVVRISLIFQNLFVALSAVSILALFYNITSYTYVVMLLEALVIILGSFATLVGQGEKIAITKDWIIVVCRNDKDLLAKTNALFRRIDLVVAILAPVALGVLMAAATNLASVIFICAWNLFSVIAEYLILLKVYKDVPELANKLESRELLNLTKTQKLNGSHSENHDAVATENEIEDDILKNENENESEVIKPPKNHFNLIARIKHIAAGWNVYRRQTVVLAGVSLALLYLTTLGFNAITIGYAYSLGLNEFQVSLCYSTAAVFGILGTFLYTIIRKKIGLAKTGLVGFLIEVSMLLLCVASIWCPGSNSVLKSDTLKVSTPMNNTQTIMYPSTQSPINLLSTPNVKVNNLTTNSNFTGTEVASPPEKVYTSIIVFMVGLIISRCGLWIIDLVVTQLQQENVREEERGIVGAVQYSFNSILDLLQFVLTIILPKTNEFGILILISISAVCTAAVVYKVFCFKFLRRSKESLDVNNLVSTL